MVDMYVDVRTYRDAQLVCSAQLVCTRYAKANHHTVPRLRDWRKKDGLLARQDTLWLLVIVQFISKSEF